MFFLFLLKSTRLGKKKKKRYVECQSNCLFGFFCSFFAETFYKYCGVLRTFSDTCRVQQINIGIGQLHIIYSSFIQLLFVS